MTQRLINAVIVAVQKSASAKYGADSARTIEIVRNCQLELSSAQTTEFPSIQSKWMNA